jgi:hypothetical protein
LEAGLVDETFLKFALEVWDKGGPIAFSAVMIGGAIWYLRKTPANNPESQMAAALKSLEARMERHHETAQAQREELKDSVSDLGQRVARIEGRMEK